MGKVISKQFCCSFKWEECLCCHRKHKRRRVLKSHEVYKPTDQDSSDDGFLDFNCEDIYSDDTECTIEIKVHQADVKDIDVIHRLTDKTYKSVGMIMGYLTYGTGFRVGEKYVMTSLHVVKEICGVGGVFNESNLKSPDVFICFDYSTDYQEYLSIFHFTGQLKYASEELDVAILELEESESKRLPPKMFCCIDFDDDRVFHLLSQSYTSPHRNVIHDVNIWQKGLDVIHQAQQWSKEVFGENGYLELDDPNFELCHCFYQYGMDGSPGIVAFQKDKLVSEEQRKDVINSHIANSTEDESLNRNRQVINTDAPTYQADPYFSSSLFDSCDGDSDNEITYVKMVAQNESLNTCTTSRETGSTCSIRSQTYLAKSCANRDIDIDGSSDHNQLSIYCLESDQMSLSNVEDDYRDKSFHQHSAVGLIDLSNSFKYRPESINDENISESDLFDESSEQLEESDNKEMTSDVSYSSAGDDNSECFELQNVHVPPFPIVCTEDMNNQITVECVSWTDDNIEIDTLQVTCNSLENKIYCNEIVHEVDGGYQDTCSALENYLGDELEDCDNKTHAIDNTDAEVQKVSDFTIGHEIQTFKECECETKSNTWKLSDHPTCYSHPSNDCSLSSLNHCWFDDNISEDCGSIHSHDEQTLLSKKSNSSFCLDDLNEEATVPLLSDSQKRSSEINFSRTNSKCSFTRENSFAKEVKSNVESHDTGGSENGQVQEKTFEPVVVFMLLTGYPTFYYRGKKSEVMEQLVGEDKLVNAGISMKTIYNDMKKYHIYRELCADIFMSKDEKFKHARRRVVSA